ncbi:probable RNA-binding protein 19 [Hyalella azteca]|uniref:Probable RNA-binding protein 19 n=1 Tax=Hyalella azteca TaxID=294128 RepID=A0A8B7P4J9_HYAAZ|nr:probable RNA-binding protein 19 [Hyalella azteca]
MSRIIVKNLPKIVTQDKLCEHFKTQGLITDSKLAFRDGIFRGFAFVGFESPEQAKAAVKTFNNTYFHNSKIVVELAKDLNDATRPKSQQQIKQEKKEQLLKKQQELCLKKERARLKASGGDASIRAQILDKYKNDPKFMNYLELNLGSNVSLLENKSREKKNKKNILSVEKDHKNNSENEEEIDDDSDKLAKKKELSDREYWMAMTKEVAEEEDNNEKNNENDVDKKTDDGVKAHSPNRCKKWKELFSVRLRIGKFPKKAQMGLSKKNKSLSKSDLRNFFSPIKVSSIRKNLKDRFEYFIGFSSAQLMNQALKKNGSILLGVRVKVSEASPQQQQDGDENAVQRRQGSAPWSEAEKRLHEAEPEAESGRLFVRNLSYLTTEKDLRDKFSQFGEIVDLELPVCTQTHKIKGFATITFMQPMSAVIAREKMDGAAMLGRVLHVLPGLSKEQVDEMNPFKSKFKQQKAKELKATAGSWHNWNTLFISSADVVEIMAKKYNKTKEQILDNEGPQSAAVTVALGETQIVDETRRFLEDNGVSVDAFSDPSVARSDTVLLVKHLPAGTKATDIAELCSKFGELGRVVMPPSGVTCIVEFLSATEAKKALRELSYKRFGNSLLYLERAPVKTFNTEAPKSGDSRQPDPAQEPPPSGESLKRKREQSDDESDEEPSLEAATVKTKKSETPTLEPEPHTTLYVQNLPLDATEEDIKKHFSSTGEVMSVVVARKGDKSLGYGFVQYLKQRSAREALISLAGSTLNGRDLLLKLSEKRLAATVKSSRQMQDYGKQLSAKISVKNIPFQATRKELEQLFRPFGALKRTFLQKHHSGEYNNGGYGFVEYLNMEDAKRALQSLGLSTHLLGRRLVLQWAKEDESVEELRQKTAQKHDFAQHIGSTHKKMREAMQEATGRTEFDE